MKKRILTALLATVILLGITLAGCEGTTGVAQEVYDRLKEQYDNLQDQYQKLQTSATPSATTTTATATVSGDCDDEIAALQAQIDALTDRYVLEGATKAETAEKIVRNYHDTHEYSTTDLFICSDMASEVWNMLKVAGIDSVVAVGDINQDVTDIVNCTHAWVLAEVAPGQYLALETTGGNTVAKTANAHYYRGWKFSSPAALKSYNEKVKEYNTLVAVRNRIAAEVNEAIGLHNNAANQTEADKYMLLYNNLKELQTEYENQLMALKNEIEGLASPFSM